MYSPEIFSKVQASLGRLEKTALDDGNNLIYLLHEVFKAFGFCRTLKNILMCRVHAITYRFYWLLYQASNINSCTFTMHKKTKKKTSRHMAYIPHNETTLTITCDKRRKKSTISNEKKTICTHLCVSLETQLRLRADEKTSLQFKASLLLWKAVYSTMRPLQTIPWVKPK